MLNKGLFAEVKGCIRNQLQEVMSLPEDLQENSGYVFLFLIVLELEVKKPGKTAEKNDVLEAPWRSMKTKHRTYQNVHDAAIYFVSLFLYPLTQFFILFYSLKKQGGQMEWE